jgi:hypothetical protein
MGRKGGIGGLLGQAKGKPGDKASRRRKKMGTGSFLRGNQSADFLSQFAARRQKQQEGAREQLRSRIQGGDRGSIFSRLFGQAAGR